MINHKLLWYKKLVHNLSHADITNFAGKFNNGQVDIIAAPIAQWLLKAFRTIQRLRYKRCLGTKGGIIRFPVIQITGNIIINRAAFPTGFGQKSREYIATLIDSSLKSIAKTEKDIAEKYWVDVLETDKPGYIKLMRESRITLMTNGIYDKKMLGLLKRVRCKHEPSSFECALKDE
jgi:hypothetical protein